MANEGFNGTTATILGSAQTPLIDCAITSSGAEVDVTGCADAIHTFEAGLADYTLTCTVVGASSVVIGDTGAVSVAWFDGTTTVFTGVVCTGADVNGALDGPITSTITAKPGSTCGTGT